MPKCRLSHSAGVVLAPRFVQEDFNSACGRLPSRQKKAALHVDKRLTECPFERKGIRAGAVLPRREQGRRRKPVILMGRLCECVDGSLGIVIADLPTA